MKYLHRLFFFGGLFAYQSTSAQCNTAVYLALNKPAFTSSVEEGSYTAFQAFNGSGTSRRTSASTDALYIYVDVGLFIRCAR